MDQLKLTAAEIQSISVNQTVIAGFFGVSTRYIATLTGEGLPRNPDNSFPLAECIQWRINRGSKVEKASSAKERKDDAQATWWQLKSDKEKELYVEKAERDRVLESRMIQLKTYLTESFMRNLREFENQKLDRLKILMSEFIEKMILAYIRD